MYPSFLTNKPVRPWTVDLLSLEKNRPAAAPFFRRKDNALKLSWSRFDGDLDLSRRAGRLKIRSAGVLGTFLRVFLTHELLELNGLLLHAAGALWEGKAAVFPGRSGSGKSTISRLVPRASLLSDEIILLYRKGTRWMAQGTPFTGESPVHHNASGPLGRLVFLRKSARWDRQDIERPDAARRLLRCTLFFGRNDPDYARLLDIVRRLVGDVSASLLHFRPDLPPGRCLHDCCPL